MDNQAVIDALKTAIAKLKTAINDLEVKKNNIGGPIAGRPAKHQQILSKIDLLTGEARALELTLIQRETMQGLAQAVTPLSNDEKTQIETGLANLDKSVAATNDFKAILKIATEIKNAAGDIVDATALA